MKYCRKFTLTLAVLLLIICIPCIVFSFMYFNHMHGIAYAASADISLATAPASQPGIAVVQPSALEGEKALLIPRKWSNDPYFDRQWAFGRFGMLPPAEGNRGEKVTVAVLDTGVDASHEDMQGMVTKNICFSDSNTPFDINGHGTHVSGIIGAVSNNNVGIAGAADNVRILNVKVAEDNGMVWASNVADGVRWAVDNGADIINMSLAAASPSRALQSAIEYAWDRGVVLVAAAGNYTKAVTYPAAFPEVIAVAAIGSDGILWENSNDGYFVDAYAPGVDIFSTLPGDTYGYCNGSSMAAAYISAFVAVAFDSVDDENGNGMGNDEIARLIQNLFRDTGL